MLIIERGAAAGERDPCYETGPAAQHQGRLSLAGRANYARKMYLAFCTIIDSLSLLSRRR